MSERYGARIVAPHFVAGLELKAGRVVRAAPIVKYMVGWDEEQVRAYVQRKDWKATRNAEPSAAGATMRHGEH